MKFDWLHPTTTLRVCGMVALLLGLSVAVTSTLQAPAGQIPTELAKPVKASGVTVSPHSTNEALNASATGTGIILQKFSVPDNGSELHLDLRVTARDAEKDGSSPRRTNESDVGHHLMVAVLRNGVIDSYTIVSGTGDAGGAYLGSGRKEAGAGLDGISEGRFTDFDQVSSKGSDLQIAVLFVRSNVSVQTRLEWVGDAGHSEQVQRGRNSVASLDIDDFESGLGVSVRPGPSAALNLATRLRSDHMLGYLDPTQGPGYVEYSYDGPGKADGRDTVLGTKDRTVLFHRSQTGSWLVELEAVFAREDDPRPVVLVGDLNGVIEVS